MQDFASEIPWGPREVKRGKRRRGGWWGEVGTDELMREWRARGLRFQSSLLAASRCLMRRDVWRRQCLSPSTRVRELNPPTRVGLRQGGLRLECEQSAMYLRRRPLLWSLGRDQSIPVMLALPG
jgi:hypothetical protein